MFLISMLISCSEEETKVSSDSGISGPTFENEEHLILETDPEQCLSYWHAGSSNMIEGAFVQMSSPTYPYEIRGASIRVLADDDYSCSSEGTIHLIAYVGDDPRRSEDIVSFMEYNTIAPYSFPELENVVSTTIALDGTSNPEALEGDRYEFVVTFEDPILVENDQHFWIGFGIHDMDDTCIVGCETSNSGLIVRQGEINEESTVPNFGVVIGY